MRDEQPFADIHPAFELGYDAYADALGAFAKNDYALYEKHVRAALEAFQAVDEMLDAKRAQLECDPAAVDQYAALKDDVQKAISQTIEFIQLSARTMLIREVQRPELLRCGPFGQIARAKTKPS